jgi:hypothetical protein
MGSKYTTQTVSGYNASPPPDDGSTGTNNKVTWANSKTKLGDPILTLAQAINTALLAALDTTQTAVSANYTTVAADNGKTIEATGAITISLGDAVSMGAGYIANVVNVGSGTVMIGLATNTNTINGGVNPIFSLAPGDSFSAKVNSAPNGYETLGTFNVLFDNADPSKQIHHKLSNITTGTLRTITWPDASITVARTDAGQTFTGNQIISGELTVNLGATGVGLSLTGTGSNLQVNFPNSSAQTYIYNTGGGGLAIRNAANNATTVLITDTQLNIGSGFDLQLGRAYSSGAVLSTGTIAIKDSTGTTYNVLVHT